MGQILLINLRRFANDVRRYFLFDVLCFCRRCSGKGGWTNKNPWWPGAKPYQECPACHGRGRA